MSKSLPIVLLTVLFGVSGARAQTEPLPIDLEERVEISLVPLDVTVWPVTDDARLCLELAADDFELTVNGKPRAIQAVDWSGSAEASRRLEEAPPEVGARTPLSIVLLFDLWRLDRFYNLGYICPRTKPVVFEDARRMIRERLKPGDRLLIVTFAGWPQIHHGWIDDPAEALIVLDEVEVSPSVLSPRTDRLSPHVWIDGMNSLLLALGGFPGRKELIYLSDDFLVEGIELSLRELAARAQANRVTISAIDPIDSCRSIPCELKGLACTRFHSPLGIAAISANTGGRLYGGGESISRSVERIREHSGCRYTVWFKPEPVDERRSQPNSRLRVKRQGLTVRMPISFQNPAKAPKEREEQDALFLLPRFGRGLRAEVSLWPLKPSGKRNRWNALMLARIRRGAEPWPEEMQELVVEIVAHQGSRIYTNVRISIVGEELRRLRQTDEPRLLVLPIEDVRPGEASVSLRAGGADGEVAASVRGVMEIPEPPGPGESGPWFLVDRLARAADQLTILPALEGSLPAGQPAVFVGYGCPDDSPGAGRVTALTGEPSYPVAIEWLAERPADRDGACGWLAGRVESALDPGLWRFESPAPSRSILFRVVGRAADEENAPPTR